MEVTITFKVPKAWFASTRITESTLKLYKFDGSSWTQLTTSWTADDSNFAHYSATAYGFGYFAIAGTR